MVHARARRASLALMAGVLLGGLVGPKANAQSADSMLGVLGSLDPAARDLLSRESAPGPEPAPAKGGGTLSTTAAAESERREALTYGPFDTLIIEVDKRGTLKSEKKSEKKQSTIEPSSLPSQKMEASEALNNRRDVRVDQSEEDDQDLTQDDEAMGVQMLSSSERQLRQRRDRQELSRLIELIRSKNPYSLNNDGALVLPGFAPITLGGLTDEEATLRLSSEPGLLRLDVRVTKLPLERLKPFGYDLFRRREAPLGSVPSVAPAPSNYVVGVGDELRVQLYGSQNRNLRLPVSREGVINFPELGPIPVAGRPLAAVIAEIESRVEAQIIGSKASVGLGASRGVEVFVVGEADKPGAFNVSDNATVTSALFAAGGIKETGSLRDVQVKRGGVIVGRLDLYEILIRGDTRSDIRLLDGDVILVPPVGPVVRVEGEVRRPAIYELKGAPSVAEVVQIAGGLTPNADRSRLVLSQTDGAQRRVLTDIALPTEALSDDGPRVGNGDALRVLSLRPVVDSGVGVEGHVYRPGLLAWREGLTLADALTSLDDLKPNADVHYVLIRRERPSERRIEVLSASLAQALQDRTSSANVRLEPRDRLIVLDQAGGRRQLIDPLIAEIRQQATVDRPTGVVSINGQVNAPGEYPLELNMRVSDLLRAGGRLKDSAFAGGAELARRKFSGDRWETELLSVDVAAVLRGDAAADVMLTAGDLVVIKRAPEWLATETITLSGEVRFPGTYPIRRGETLRSVIERAGGLTSLANPQGAIFTREELKDLERREISRLAERLQKELAATAVLTDRSTNAADASAALLLVQNVIEQLRDVKPVGRLVIDLNQVLAARMDSSRDVILRAGDRLAVPKFRQEVSVIGEVQNVTAHLYRQGLELEDYLSLSGGLTGKADKRRISVVRADGSVRSRSGSSWFSGIGADNGIRPGDTIVVPLDTESLPRLAQLQLWQTATGILYNSAVAFAALQGL